MKDNYTILDEETDKLMSHDFAEENNLSKWQENEAEKLFCDARKYEDFIFITNNNEKVFVKEMNAIVFHMAYEILIHSQYDFRIKGKGCYTVIDIIAVNPQTNEEYSVLEEFKDELFR